MKAQLTNQIRGVLAVGALTLGSVAGFAGTTYAGAGDRALVVQGDLRDLQPATTEPLEGADAKLTMATHNGESTFVLRVHGIDLSAVGHEFGAHLHVGPCVAGDGAAAGSHYNTATPAIIDDMHEVWLDFVVTDEGTGTAVAHVPFVATPGNRAIVIHAMGTDPHTGGAGPRLACLPVSW